MTMKLDWAAPIVPGRSMMGLNLGMTFLEVERMLFDNNLPDQAGYIQFENSPVLKVDSTEKGMIVLRAKDVRVVNYSWQDDVSRLIFEDDQLSDIVISALLGEESMQYKGLIFNKAGLGSLVSDLFTYGSWGYDSGEELFYPLNEPEGILIGGSSACDLSEDPQQIISFIRVLRVQENGK